MSKQKPTSGAAAPGAGLRERKKRQTRLEISDIATRLFMERGFENVTVAEVAAAANVSVNTVFNYFSTKEELFFDRTEGITWASDVVRGRRRGESAVRALRRVFRKSLEEAELARPSLRPFVATIEASPALVAHARALAEQSEQQLASTLAAEAGVGEGDAKARTVAALVSATMALILRELRRGILEQRDVAVLRAAVSRLGEQGFELLLAAAGDYCTRPSDDADRSEDGGRG